MVNYAAFFPVYSLDEYYYYHVKYCPITQPLYINFYAFVLKDVGPLLFTFSLIIRGANPFRSLIPAVSIALDDSYPPDGIYRLH